MNLETIREYCLRKKGVTEDFPFGEETLVFRVIGKIFLLVDTSFTEFINLKADPEMAIEWRERYEGVSGISHEQKALEQRVSRRIGSAQRDSDDDRSFVCVDRVGAEEKGQGEAGKKLKPIFLIRFRHASIHPRCARILSMTV